MYERTIQLLTEELNQTSTNYITQYDHLCRLNEELTTAKKMLSHLVGLIKSSQSTGTIFQNPKGVRSHTDL